MYKRQGHQILVDALQDEVYICPCHGNAAGQSFFVGLGVDVVLFQDTLRYYLVVFQYSSEYGF